MLAGNSYRYDYTVTNKGSSPISSFSIKLGNAPSNMVAPEGWRVQILKTTYRRIVQWVASSASSDIQPQDPTLELHDGNGALLAGNDNWRSDQEAEIIATGIPPTNDLESAILRTLPPGPYLAIVKSKDNSTGVALVEAYQLQ